MIIGYDAKRIYHNASGLGNYSRDMIRILSEKAPENRYLLYNPQKGKVDRFRTDNDAVQEKRPSGLWKLFNAIWRQGPIVRQLVDDNVQIYHGLSGELPRGIQKSGIKTIVTIHDLIFLTHPEYYNPIDRKIYTDKLKYALNSSDLIVSISQYTKHQILDRFDVDPNKIKVVYQTCHSVFKKLKESINSNRNQVGSGDYLLMVGTIEERKNALTLIKAIANSDYKVVLVGRHTSYAESVKHYIQEHGLGRQVQLISDITMQELIKYYQRAKMLVYTSVVEGFGIPLIEAGFAGLPIICHHQGVFREAAGPHSFYADMEDIGALRKAIDLLWNDEDGLLSMSNDGLRYVEKFEDDVIASKVMELYNYLIA